MLSTNFQESRRIENQLKGRAGRQVCCRHWSLRFKRSMLCAVQLTAAQLGCATAQIDSGSQ